MTVKHTAARAAGWGAHMHGSVTLLRAGTQLRVAVSVSERHQCDMVTSDQPQPLDLSIQTPQPQAVKESASPWQKVVRSCSISDGESGDSGRDRSRSPETPSVSLSVTPTPSDASSGDAAETSHRYPVTKRFLHKYQAEQSQNTHHHHHHESQNTAGQHTDKTESLVNNKDLLSYGESAQSLTPHRNILTLFDLFQASILQT